jgi:SRSO17 transposase
MAEAAARLPNELFPHVEITRRQLEPCLENLDKFLERYAPRFYRLEQRDHARTYMEGRLSDLPRKTCEPIATDHDQNRWLIQHFVGMGLWEDEKILSELHLHVREELGDPAGILILDGSDFEKKGNQSVGVKRQWCGRLGKVENCQAGVYLAYAGNGDAALVDHRLYLPKEWCRSPKRRKKARIPKEVHFQTKIQIANDLLKKDAARFPHAWIVGDDEFGRPAWFRRSLARRKERYLLEVPSNTRIRDLAAPSPKRRSKRGRLPKPPFVQATDWAHAQPASAWTRIVVHDGEKGPIQFEAILARVRAKNEQKVGPIESFMVMRTLGPKPEYRFYLSNADEFVSLDELVRVAQARHLVEECFERAKGEAGLAHYEVRSWVGWHHHMTLGLAAAWFLSLEKRRVGGKNTGSDGPAHGPSLPDAVA